MTAKDNIDEKLENLSHAIGSDEKLVENVMSRINNDPGFGRSQAKIQNIWRIIIKSPVSKLAAAAVIIIAVLIINFKFNTSGVAWGVLVEKIESVDSVVCHTTSNSKMKSQPQGQTIKMEFVSYYSSEYGKRLESYSDGKPTITSYLNLKEQVSVTVMHEAKKFMRETYKSPIKMSEQEDPRVIVRNMMSEEYKKLGRDRINGIYVEGIECIGSKVMGDMFNETTTRLWVKIGTDFPVRIEIEGIVLGEMEVKMVMDDFQWNVDLDQVLFVPDIPSDYTIIEINLTDVNEVVY